LEPHTLRALVLLLYGAGLRVSEAVNLTLADVDLPNALLTVHRTKFDKTRLVPLGADLHQVMAQYLSERQSAGHAQTGTAPFFVLRSGAPVSIQLLELHFRHLRVYAGVQRTDGARYQPRLHDLRHNSASWIIPSTFSMLD
jgi:site-specific recombinase XerD